MIAFVKIVFIIACALFIMGTIAEEKRDTRLFLGVMSVAFGVLSMVSLIIF